MKKKATRKRGPYKKKDHPQPQKQTLPSKNGLQLLTIETGQPIRYVRNLNSNPDYQKLRELLKIIKLKQCIPLKKEWKVWPRKIVKDDKLAIEIVVTKIADNPKFVRVFRTK